MTDMAYTNEQYKKLLISLQIQHGPRSIAGAIRPEKLDAIASRMQSDGCELSESAAHTWLGPFRAYFGQMNFFSSAEIEANIRRAQVEKNTPRTKPDDGDVPRGTLKSMSAIQRLEFANARETQKPVVLSIDGENFTKENE
jgi:hypothetical protein